MSRASLRRALAERLMRWSERLMPGSRRPWAQAMRAELDHIDRERDVLAWAFGCCVSSFGLRIREILVKRESIAGFVIAFVSGFAIWGLSPLLTGHTEPWDAGSMYYTTALLVTGLVAGGLCPRRIWPVLPGVALGQFTYMLLFLPKGPLIAVGFVTLFVFGVLTIGAAFAASRLRRLVSHQEP